MADSDAQPQLVGIQIKPAVEQAVDSTGHYENPNRIAERTRLAREEQKKKRKKLTENKEKLLWWLTHHQLKKTRTPQ